MVGWLVVQSVTYSVHASWMNIASLVRIGDPYLFPVIKGSDMHDYNFKV